jgi:hypothetical protein
MRPASLTAIAHEITLDGLPEAFATLLQARARGRFLVALS